MRRLYILLLALLCAGAVFGQDNTADAKKRVAVATPTATVGVDPIDVSIVRGKLVEYISAMQGYEAFTRTDIDQITKEMAFEQSGMVNDADKKKLGVLKGVDIILVSTLTYGRGRLNVEAKFVHVETGKMENAISQVMNPEVPEDMEISCKTLAENLTGVSSTNKVPSGTTGGISHLNGEVWSPDGIELVFVEGTGSGLLSVKNVYIGKYVVTQAQWRAIMGNNPSSVKGDNLPVDRVNWNDAQEFITKLNAKTGRTYRLPAEAEWEYAARGGSKSQGYQYSGSNNIDEVAWYYENTDIDGTHSVGTKKPNELGIYDMTGNVWEWCEDWYNSSQRDRAVRGGNWNSFADFCGVSNRVGKAPDIRGLGSTGIGFRLVLVP